MSSGTRKPWTLSRVRTLWIFGAAGVVALSVYLVLIWPERRDNPRSRSQQNQGDIAYEGEVIHVVIKCECPEVLTESVSRVLPLEFTLQRAYSWKTFTPGVAPQGIYVLLDAGNAILDPSKISLTDSTHLMSGNGTSQSASVRIKAADTTVSQIRFSFYAGDMSMGSVDWPITSQSRSMTILEPYAYSLGVFATVAWLFWWTDKRLKASRERSERRFVEAKTQADANPERVRFAWDLARVKLEAYFDRNLIQVNLVFWVAVFVMTVGFSFVLWGVFLSFNQPKFTPTTMVAAVSGIITQFIGATFMVIYRSTITQANEFMTVLERINTVGMVVQILDSLPDGTDLKNQTRANIATLLLSSSNIHGGTKPAPVKSA
ncbi:MAG: hypothetical protein JWN74_1237 [Acidobacteriaceae bacterium]|nr:hypothetical protein [Acidobacteriaceae bacterium]